MMKLQQYVNQAVCQAYYQSVAHASQNFSKQLSGSNLDADFIVPRQDYQSDSFHGGVNNRQVVAFGTKGVELA